MNNSTINKTKKIIIASLIGMGTLGGLTSYATAFGGFGHHNKAAGSEGRSMPADFMVYRISSKLDLNDDQKSHLEGLKTTVMDLIKTRKEQSNRDKAKELLSAPVLDQDKALALLEERQTKMLTTAPSIIAAIAKFTDSLTEEQRTTLLELMDKFGKHQGRPFGRGFSGGFGSNQ